MTQQRSSGPALGRVVVVGGANTDIVGVPAAALVERDSNPGHVRRSPGGVGRNIAENLARLGVSTDLVSAFGADANGTALMQECAARGICTSQSVVVDDVPGSIYLAVLDGDGDLAVAINDMRALDRLTPVVLSQRRDLLESASLVVLDANLPEETLIWIAENISAPLFVDTTSQAKAPRVRRILGRVRVLKLNGFEAGVLVGHEVRDAAHAEQATRELLASGVGSAFITLGTHGVVAGDESGTVRLPPPAVHVVNATGAGDAFSAGLVMGTLSGLSLAETAELGSAMAAMALTSERTVSDKISREAAAETMKEIRR